MKTQYLRTGWYPENHKFYGFLWIGFGGMPDKMWELSNTSDYLPENDEFFIPIFNKSSNSDYSGLCVASYSKKALKSWDLLTMRSLAHMLYVYILFWNLKMTPLSVWRSPWRLLGIIALLCRLHTMWMIMSVRQIKWMC